MRSSAEFAATTRSSVRAATPAVVVHARAAGTEGVRVGFVVSRRVGNAVTRNQLLRRLRHLVRDRLDSLPVGTSLVVRANVGAASLPFVELRRYVDDALRRALGSLSPADGR